MANTPETQLEKFTPKVLYSVSGAAFAVWVICLVLSNLLPPKYLTPLQMRWIAAGVSLLLGFGIYKIPPRRQGLAYLRFALTFGLLNGCLIFIHASGVNAISTGLFQDQGQLSQTEKGKKASILSLDKEVSWWPDSKLKRQNERLMSENTTLKSTLNSISNPLNGNVALSDSIKSLNTANNLLAKRQTYLKSTNDSLASLVLKLKSQLSILSGKALRSSAPPNTTIPANPYSPIIEDVRRLEQSLSSCQQDNIELTRKLTSIKNYQKLLKEAERDKL